MRSIFRKRNADVEALFQSAGCPEKVMCVPFDYAKKTHTAMVCNGRGDRLRGVQCGEQSRGARFSPVGYHGALLKAHSSAAHRMHRVVDELFPGFLNDELSGITAFSRASLWLMDENFSAASIGARQRPALVRRLREFSLRDPEGAVEKLKALAHNALPAPDEMIGALQRSLCEEMTLYQQLDGAMHGLDTDIAKILARTPGAMLTTIPGIGLRWAPGLFSELGDPLRRRSVHSMAALGGIVPGTKQTGGPEKTAVTGYRRKNCSSFLKSILMSGAVSISQYGHAEMRQTYQADKAMGRDARTRMAQRLLRASLYLIDTQAFFLPPSLHRGGTREQIRQYYAQTWPKVLIKWRDSGAIKQAVAEGAPLRIWRDMAQELYGIELDLRSPQSGRK